MRSSTPLLLTVAATCLAACTERQPFATESDLDVAARSAKAGATPTVQFVATRDPDVLTTVGDVVVSKSGYGSGMALVPGTSRDFYLLTDRGPNYDGPRSAGTPKRFPDPTYAPRIYRAHISGTKLRLDGEIVLKAKNGTPMTGLPLPSLACGNTLEIGQNVDGSGPLSDVNGLDPEGIVALRDGSFWLSDEYGPFMVHFDATGREIERYTPCNNGGLPEVYKLRRPNRGMEGLTITPDGQWLVGIMQAPLENPAQEDVRDKSLVTRILFKHLTNGSTREYLYLLDSPTIQGNSEILALSATRFLVLERDGTFLFGPRPATLKRIYEIDITNATDVSALGVLGATPVEGKTLERSTEAQLLAAGIKPVTKRERVELTRLGYPHDKPEGLAMAPGNMLFVINDDDFGIVSQAGVLTQKILPPTTQADKPSLWQIRLP
ncbi:esterase-like activity of phytase family protein [Gemmatimonas phototrophica]|uniref:esterase-like activity of phytase family protein n=1 Tax=Gemmatimonas phototrophica TaxID=1379270 RepID=UPI0006A6F512|nr:esterase-like activity of phytase family protein [Gemmatimonas phototrophica]